MSEGTGKGRVVEFPGGEDSFAWRSKDGKLHHWVKGRYALVRNVEGAELLLGDNREGAYQIVYLTPDNREVEKLALKFEGQEVVEEKEITSATDYEALQEEGDKRNRESGFAR